MSTTIKAITTAGASLAMIAATTLPALASTTLPKYGVFEASAPGYALTTPGTDYGRLYLSRAAQTTRQDFTLEPGQNGAVMIEWTPEGRQTGLVATAEGSRVVLALADMNDPANQWKVRSGALVSEAGGRLSASGAKVTVARAKSGAAQSWVIR